MRISKLLGCLSADSIKRTSGFYWPAIAGAYAIAIGAFLGFDLVESYALSLGANFGRQILMMAANFLAILGSFIAVLMARGCSERKLCWHACIVWLAVTLTLMAQIAVSTGIQTGEGARAIAAKSAQVR